MTTQARPPHHQLLPTRVDEILSFQVLGSARPCALHLHPLHGLCVLITQAPAPMPSQAPCPRRCSAADGTSQSTSDIPASSELWKGGSLLVLVPCSWLRSLVPRARLPPRTCCLLELALTLAPVWAQCHRRCCQDTGRERYDRTSRCRTPGGRQGLPGFWQHFGVLTSEVFHRLGQPQRHQLCLEPRPPFSFWGLSCPRGHV